MSLVLLELLVLDNLNPVAIRVEDESNALHAAVGQPLLPVDTLLFPPLASRINVIHGDTDMAKTLRLIVAIVVLEVLILLRPIIPSQLQNTLTIRLLRVLALEVDIGQKVQVELRILVLTRPDERHTHDILVELQTLLRILDTDHAVVESISLDICRRHTFRLGSLALADNLNPVTIRVEREGNALHAPIGQAFLEFDAGVLEALAGGLDVVDANACVAKTLAGLGVAVGDFEVRVVLGAVVVCEFKDTLTAGPSFAGGDGFGAVVGEEIEVELGFGLLDLVDLLQAEEFVEFDAAFRVLDSNHGMIEDIS